MQSVLTFSWYLSFLYEGSFFIGHVHWMDNVISNVDFFSMLLSHIDY
jgi:hypothetical protein